MNLPHDPAMVLLGTYPKETKTDTHQNNLHISIYNSFIHKSQKLKTTHVSSNG